MLTRKGRKLLPGPNAAWTDDPLAALYGTWLVLINNIDPTQHRYRRHRYNWDRFAEELDALLPTILIDIYRHGDTPIKEIVEDLWTHLYATFDLDDVPTDKLMFHKTLVENSLRAAFDILGELGTLRVEDVTEIPTRHGGTDRTGGVAGLTALAKWAVPRLASKVASAPIVGALRELTAAELLTAASDISEAEAVGEIDAWIDCRGDQAAGQLVEALRTADETERGLGFRALLRIGPQAADAMSRLSDDTDLAPYVTVWRIDTLTGNRDDMDCTGDAERFVRLLDIVIGL